MLSLQTNSILSIAIILLNLIASSYAHSESSENWFDQGQKTLKRALSKTPIKNNAKNIILFVGDGMSLSTITAARILQGQQQGRSGEENKLAMEQMDYVGLAKTYSVDQQVPDSAGTMTAMMTGYKTRDGIISLNQNAERGNCNSSKDTKLNTLLEHMEQKGYTTGIISTARITHATPAATYAHSPERNWESQAEDGCKDIASQLISFGHGDGIDIIFAGGRQHFLPEKLMDPEYPTTHTGKRKDNRNLIDEWQKKYPTGTYIWNKQQFLKINKKTKFPVLGLFEPSHMQYESDRDINKEPHIAELTLTAIDLLKRNKQGFFLMVEAGRIDHAHHDTNAYRALHDTVAFDEAIKETLKVIDLKNTLVIVTADHGHVFTIAGYPKRGNPILGKVIPTNSNNKANNYSLANDGLPYTTLGYTNSGTTIENFTKTCEAHECEVQAHRKDLTNIDTTAKDFLHEGLIPLYSETHSGEDVAIFASGPWAHLLQGVHEQNYIYHVMKFALNPKPM